MLSSRATTEHEAGSCRGASQATDSGARSVRISKGEQLHDLKEEANAQGEHRPETSDA